MASLQIDLFDKTNKRRIWVMLRDNLPIKDLIHKLIQDLELPQGEYILVDEEENVTLPQESTLAKEGVKDQHPLRIEPKKKVVPIPIPIPIKKGGEAGKSGDAKAPRAKPGAKTREEKAAALKEPSPENEQTAPEESVPEEIPETDRKAEPAPARGLPPTRPILPPLRRPIRRPPFLRGIPNQLWGGCATPLNILLILLVLLLFCLLGRLTCNIQFPLVGCQAQPVTPNIRVDGKLNDWNGFNFKHVATDSEGDQLSGSGINIKNVYAFFEDCFLYCAIESDQTIPKDDIEQYKIVLEEITPLGAFQFELTFEPGDSGIVDVVVLDGDEVVEQMEIGADFAITGEVIELKIPIDELIVISDSHYVIEGDEVPYWMMSYPVKFEMEMDCYLDIPEPVEVDAEPIDAEPIDVEPITEEVKTLIISAENDFTNHNCDPLYSKSHELTKKCNYGLEIATNDEDKAVFYYCQAMVEYWNFNLRDSKEYFDKALELGLTGEEKDNAEKILAEIELMDSQGPCKIGEMSFADGWFDKTPLRSIELSENAKEIYVNVEFDSDECDADVLEVVWSKNNQVACRHSYKRKDFENKKVIGSMYDEEDGGILPKVKYTVQIFNGSTLLGIAYYNHY